MDLVESFGRKDTNIQRGREAGINPAEIQKRFATMDSSGVDLQVLSVTPQSPHFENTEHAVIAARKANDMYAEAVQRWPKRLAAFAALPLPHIDESLHELDRALGQLGMRGVGITTDILGRSIADPAFTPLYEELNRRRSALFIHPAGDGAYSPLIADYQIIWMIGAPVEDTVAVLHLITRGIPSPFPQMKIITAHVGGALPSLLERLTASLRGKIRGSRRSRARLRVACGTTPLIMATYRPCAAPWIGSAPHSSCLAAIFLTRMVTFTDWR